MNEAIKFQTALLFLKKTNQTFFNRKGQFYETLVDWHFHENIIQTYIHTPDSLRTNTTNFNLENK